MPLLLKKTPEASTAGIGEIIAQDVGMTAKVLQLVNSSFFGMPRHVASPSEAVVLLGIDVVKTLILSIEPRLHRVPSREVSHEKNTM